MTKKQRESVAKYVYDLSKIIFATIVIGQIIKPEDINLWRLINGITATICTFGFAYLLERSED